VLAVEQGTVTGTFNIAGPYPFLREDCRALHRDAASVITLRAPEVAAAFHDRGWTLPGTVDRIYDSSAAGAAFGYRPVRDVLHLLRG
jgi:UDP-glucose 4-epimerase